MGDLFPDGLLLDPDGLVDAKVGEGLEEGPALDPDPPLPPVGLTPLVAPLNPA